MTNAPWTAPMPAEVEGPLTGSSMPIIQGYLGWYRRAFAAICAGLTAEQLASRPIPSTSLSLLGIACHLAKVERGWLRQRFADDGTPPLFDPELGKDHDFEAGVAADAAAALEVLRSEQELGDLAVAKLSPDYAITVHGEQMSLLALHLHLIGEYARHNGHADLLREAIDGVTAR